jgi:uncharacterized protein YecT (DUF1311 family)
MELLNNSAKLGRLKLPIALYTGRFIAVVTLGLFISFSASAQDNQFTKQFSNCIKKSGGIASAMLDCIAAETKIQDARLNNAYKQLMGSLRSDRKKKLLAAQRLWIQYRDANCGFYADPEGGTSATVSSNDCFLRATASRAQELQNFIK